MKRGTSWSVAGFERAGCFECGWNRTEGGWDLMAGNAAKACAHADETGHRTYVQQRRIREFRSRLAPVSDERNTDR